MMDLIDYGESLTMQDSEELVTLQLLHAELQKLYVLLHNLKQDLIKISRNLEIRND